jgi:phage shock protein PspC (stress-responsive transcriptional regulator)
LLRDQEQKMIAGVCTGLGRHFDVDPVIFRVLFALLTFFGGLGILAYAAAWLLIPEAGERSSEAQRLLTGTNAYVAAAAAALMVLGLWAFAGFVADSIDRSVPLVLAGAAVIGVLIWHKENPGRQCGGGTHGDGGNIGGDPADPSAQPQAWWQRPVPFFSEQGQPREQGGPGQAVSDEIQPDHAQPDPIQSDEE